MVGTAVHSLHPGSIVECAHLYGMWHYPSPKPVPVGVLEANKLPAKFQKLFDYTHPQSVKGAIMFWLHSAAIMLTRPERRPDLNAWKRSPFSFQP